MCKKNLPPKTPFADPCSFFLKSLLSSHKINSVVQLGIYDLVKPVTEKRMGILKNPALFSVFLHEKLLYSVKKCKNY